MGYDPFDDLSELERDALAIGGDDPMDRDREALAREVGPVGEEDSEVIGDELEERQRQEAEASVDHRGQRVSDFGQAAQARYGRHNAIIQKAPYSRINPESSYRGVLGNQVTIPTSEAGGQPRRVVYWDGEDVEACPVSICYSLVAYPAPSGALFSFPYLQVLFGTRNGLARVDIDTGAGGQLTVPASVIFVSVGLGAGSSVPCTLAASLAFYPVVRTPQITLTSSLTPAAGVAVTVARPAFATNVWLVRTDTASTYTLNFLNTSAAGPNTYYTQVIAAGAYLNAPIPLSNDVYAINVTSSAGGTARLIWGLSL